ncbi:TIGR01440 family protein [Alkalihalobacillus sp. LMS39]|uniref:TIGR01440 family protein n=1 Tax=Alkalihalobacillus sp. LMS39 TaxID=2924032 RepID=UPI001FB28216|nr:TIGR01440 family protein [Alkalihalobacillus sp. LMS39]UOE93952.1 TIGR01440 family protein [Alkalihalobacillus sp. LMS39]
MMIDLSTVKKDLQTVLNDLISAKSPHEGAVVVVGTSTSEVVGEKIGTSGSEEVSKVIFETLHEWAKTYGLSLAFQCCEHVNRALVVEKETQMAHHLEEVTVLPVKTAGGAMASYAYTQMKNPVVVEFIKADAGIDIGDTLIGMHLKHVAVPVRSTVKEIGQAHVTLAVTRPKLIGGQRAVYPNNNKKTNEKCM